MTNDQADRIAAVVDVLLDAGACDAVIVALECGRLRRESTGAIRASISGGDLRVEQQLVDLQAAWPMSVSATELATSIRIASRAVAGSVARAPRTQVVWTGPGVDGSFLRSTREVVRELVAGATRELLVVGYWLAANDEDEGIIVEVIDSLASASVRGVAVTLLLDERVRSDGRNNRDVLVDCWPATVGLPRLLTWRLPKHDAHLKLHAKVLISDRRDALVTSANLTMYAMDRNMEMGIRLTGAPARDIARHFELLECHGIIEPFETGDVA